MLNGINIFIKKVLDVFSKRIVKVLCSLNRCCEFQSFHGVKKENNK